MHVYMYTHKLCNRLHDAALEGGPLLVREALGVLEATCPLLHTCIYIYIYIYREREIYIYIYMYYLCYLLFSLCLS